MLEWRSSRLETRLTALDELKEQREDLQTTIDELKESIEEKRKAYHQALDQLQIGLIQFQERLKREAIDYLNELAKDFRRHRTNQISETIQRELSSERTDRTSHRTIGQIYRNQAQSLGRQRRSHPHGGHSRRCASPMSEETSHDRTPSSPNLIESSWTDADERRWTTKSTERNSVGQRREEDSSERCVHVSVQRRERSSQRHDRSSSDLHRSFHSGGVLLTSNARRYDSLDPRLNVLESLSVSDLSRQVTQSEQMKTLQSTHVRPSLPILISINFNRSQPHPHYLRELI